MRFVVNDLTDGYTKICRAVLRYGAQVSPRDQLTREIMDAVIVVENPALTLPVGVGRGPNAAIAVAEGLQLVTGFSYPRLMTTITRNFNQFFDGGILHGAYGPRVRPQIHNVIKRLNVDHDTRQAVITVWDPLYDGWNGSSTPSDLPCTVSLQFTIRDGKLNMHTHMRSNDVWWGLAYDAFQFTRLQMAIALELDIPLGKYYHHATSLHAYERDWNGIDDLHQATEGDAEPWAAPVSFRQADMILADGRCTDASVRWYLDQLPDRELWT